MGDRNSICDNNNRVVNKQEKLTSCQQKLMWMKVYALNLAFMTLEIMQQLSSGQIPQLLRRAYH